MSSLVTLQQYDNVFMGSDTATSATIKDDIYRLSEDGKKLYAFDKQLIFCSGNMDVAYKIMQIYTETKIKNIKNLQSIARLYCHKDATIEIVVAEINKEENKINVFQISSYKDFEIIEKEINKGDLGIYTGGIKVEEAFNVAYENIQKGIDVLNVFQNTFDEISYEGVGGNLLVYQINLNGVQKIYQNKIQEKNIRYITEAFNKHLVVAESLFSKVIGSEKLTITNTEGNFVVDGNSMTAHNMRLSLDTDNGNGKIYIDPEVGIKIQNNSSGSWQDVLYMNTEGDLTMDGRLKITNNGITLFDIWKNSNGSLMQIFDGQGNLNISMGSEEGTANNQGGKLILYNDDKNKPRVEVGISKTYDAGAINLKNSSGNVIIEIYADSNIGEGVYVNKQRLATENYVRSYVADYVDSHMPSSDSGTP